MRDDAQFVTGAAVLAIIQDIDGSP